MRIDLSARFPDETPIEQLGLPTRVCRALMNEGLKTVGDVRNLTDIELLRSPDWA
ncbi:DNA-directed RNA polymerase subunit alpha C-terminal domain-containing protein [Bradyrhizobium sp. I1.7.5]|uniref:DNA-directed RNA polymerase subunit alpha C-terminal domain-containing protein n=1 Tax=Bradyrhizobium sp. I1.7.5 TaxID=3156363 RepID=UPI0033976E77